MQQATRAVALATLVASLSGADAGERIALAGWASRLPNRFVVHGVKTEPTYQEAIDLTRDGDVFAATGGAPGWAERLTERVEVATDGAVRRQPCAARPSCVDARPPSGFLATAALVASVRRGRLAGFGQALPYGAWRVVCVDADALGLEAPLLDPCFELRSGAAIAQRHRVSGGFDGPSLAPESIRFDQIQ
jgi:hypothetical protein